MRHPRANTYLAAVLTAVALTFGVAQAQDAVPPIEILTTT
jgi:hypothetical protein